MGDGTQGRAQRLLRSSHADLLRPVRGRWSAPCGTRDPTARLTHHASRPAQHETPSREGPVVEEDHREHDQEHDVEGQRDAVERVARDAAEDILRASSNAARITREPRRREDERGGAPGRVGRARHGHAAVRLLERGRVVHAVAGHGHEVPARLERLDDGVLVLRGRRGRTRRRARWRSRPWPGRGWGSCPRKTRRWKVFDGTVVGSIECWHAI